VHEEARLAVLATIPVGTRPSRIIAAGGQVWVLDPVDRTLSRIDPDTDTVAQTIAVGSDPSDLVLSDGSLWTQTEATAQSRDLIRTPDSPSTS
jgi:YVTN family beta-propeller protein